jgi:amino acid transporter
MTNKNLKRVISIVGAMLVLFPGLCLASALDTKVIGQNLQQTQAITQNNFNTQTKVGDVIATVIQTFIGLLGMIFIVLIVYAGYSWLTAAGDEAKVTKARETLQRAVIGLVIVLAAYSITYFVFTNLNNLSVTAGGGGTSGL